MNNISMLAVGGLGSERCKPSPQAGEPRPPTATCFCCFFDCALHGFEECWKCIYMSILQDC